MAIEILPTEVEDPHFTQRTALDGVDFIFRFNFNQRAHKWYVNVFDQDDEPLVAGVKLTPNRSVFEGVTDSRRPPGLLVAIDLHEHSDAPRTPRDPGYSHLGERVVLFYYDLAELQADGRV